MKALTLHAPRDLRHESVPDAELRDAGDALVRVTTTAVCGSDLHPWHGREAGLDIGTVMGHEFVGEVLAVGRDVRGLTPGDRVVSPFSTSCGACPACASGLTARCERGELFGWVAGGAGLQGVQAELARVPLADSTLVRIPSEMDPEAALFAGDVLSTALHWTEAAGVRPGSVFCVVGCGPVGLLAVQVARELGAAHVFALDLVPERLELARRFRATALDVREDGTLARVREETGGRGADAVLEAVGTPAASRLALDLVRAGGTLAAAGVHTEPAFAFTPGEAYDKNLTYVAGRCPARAVMERALALVAEGRVDPLPVVSHRLSLADGPHAYRMFDEKRDGCTKVLLTP